MVTRFPAEGIELIYIIILESAPLLILLFWNSVIAGVFNSYKYFYIPALSPALRAIINLSLIFYLKDKFGIHAVSIGYVFGELFRVIVLFKLLNKFCLFNLKISISWDIKLRGFLRVSFYQFAGMTAVAFTPIINKSMASWIGPSSVSLLEYSNRLYIIPLVFMSSGLVVPLLSHWSERYQQGGKEGLDKDVIKAVKVIGIFSIFLSLFLFIFRTNIVNIIYGYGRLSINQIDSIAGIWGLQVLGLAPNILSHVYSRTHLIKMNTRFILYSSLLIVVAGFLLNIALIPSMGVRGIALSSTLVAFLYLFLMSYFYYYRQ
jgi:putative peptidoglycan lipid II flippase